MKINLKKNLALLDKNITAWSKHGDESFKKGDRTMTLCYYADVGRLQLLKFFVQQELYLNAYAVAYWLDTVVRDQVPTELYRFLENFDKTENKS